MPWFHYCASLYVDGHEKQVVDGLIKVTEPGLGWLDHVRKSIREGQPWETGDVIITSLSRISE